MTGPAKKKFNIKIIIIVVSSALLFIFFGTLIVDALLIGTGNAPFFSNISAINFNNGEIVAGRGVLYKTVAHRIEASNGYLAGYAIFFPWDKGYADLETAPPAVEMKFHAETTLEYVGAAPDDEEMIEVDDMETLNMDTVKRLADGEIDPFDFMEKFPGTVYEETESAKYFLRLMNNYALQIEYSGDTVIEMRLIDELHNQYINIQTQMIDTFLDSLREQE